MNDEIRKQLEKEEPTELHKKLLEHCKKLVTMSRNVMKDYYDLWDATDDVYRGIRIRDRQDVDAGSRGEPEKMVVPISFAQTQTFVAFCSSLYTQRERIFELIGRGEEDHKAAKIGEALLDRDLVWNTFDSRLYQFLLDVARFGLGVFKVGWHKEVETKEVAIEVPAPQAFGLSLGLPTTVMENQEVVRYLGNKVVNVSPYNFYPDPRLSLGRFQEGEFVASEEIYTRHGLSAMEKNGEVAGTKWVKRYSQEEWANRHNSTRLARNIPVDALTASIQGDTSVGMVVITECQVTLVPADFEADGVKLGKETWPVKWVVWYCNDNRVVKAEPLGYKHNQYTYALGEYTPDMHKLVNEGLADSISKLQDVISWFINSHITNVRKVIGDRLVVDPSGVEMKDLVERRPVIRLKEDAARAGVDKFVKQLAVVDVTTNHMTDADVLHGLVQVVTGISDNAMGQFYTGRRTATEARNVNSATAARLKLVALMLFRSALEPMARQMLSNHQQGLDVETYVRVLGELADPAVYAQFVKVTKDDLVGDYDFEVFDGTLPSERGIQAEALQEFLGGVMQNPQTVMLLGYDPRKLTEEWLELRGIRNPKRFEMDQVRQQELLAQLQAAGLTEVANATEVGTAGVAGVPGGPIGLPMPQTGAPGKVE